MQLRLPFDDNPVTRFVAPFKTQLLKWIGNKQRFAHEIVSYFPQQFGTYFEPFLGSGAVLGTLAPSQAVGADVFGPLVEIWQTFATDPELLKHWYQLRRERLETEDHETVYEGVKADYNAKPNGADLLYLCRACYGGVVRFRKKDGHMSTPCGVHTPIPSRSFSERVDLWRKRCGTVQILQADFAETMNRARPGDLIYCDPPYSDTQSILYGAQEFSLNRLFSEIERCKARGVFVALSLDGTKQSGNKVCNIPVPPDLFEEEASVNCGRSMLRRFQMAGQTLEGEEVHDRLLLTYQLSQM